MARSVAVDEAVIHKLFTLVRQGKPVEDFVREIHSYNAAQSYNPNGVTPENIGDNSLLIHARDKNGNTLLMEAARLRKVNLVRYITSKCVECVKIPNLEGLETCFSMLILSIQTYFISIRKYCATFCSLQSSNI